MMKVLKSKHFKLKKTEQKDVKFIEAISTFFCEHFTIEEKMKTFTWRLDFFKKIKFKEIKTIFFSIEEKSLPIPTLDHSSAGLAAGPFHPRK